jgi:alpha-L-fucosidase
MHTDSPDTRSRWFPDARFGMFIHWGLYSNPAGVWQGRKIKHAYGEWLQASEHVPRPEYRKLAAAFNPTGFDAEEWAQIAKSAGMKYMVITAKHHDGFALWPTRASRYNVMDETPFKRDILGELAAACRKFDIRLGFYYSHWQDWEGTGGDVCQTHMVNEEYVHPGADEFARYWERKCLVQVRELLDNYDPWLLWFDSWNKDSFTYITSERQDELISLVRSRSAKCLVNSRIQFLGPSDRVDYISMMDNEFPEQGQDKPWETSGTLNHSWGYHQLDFDWKPTAQLLKHLVGNAANGGNYQLNVGPMGNGRFQDAAIKRLRELGLWLGANGEAVYGTGRSPLGKPDWGRITARPMPGNRTRLYLHLWDFTPGTALLLDGVHNAPVAARVLETGQPVGCGATDAGLWLRLPKELRGLELPVIALDVDGTPARGATA